MVKAVYFDLDGTLLDVSRRFHRALNTARVSEGAPEMEWDEFERRYGKDVLTEQVPAERHGHFWRLFLEEFSHNPEPHLGEPFPGVTEALGELRRRGLRTAVITNRASQSDAVRGELSQMGMEAHFDVVLSQGDFNFRRGDFATDLSLYSKESMIHHASEKLGLEPAGVAFVGDLITDIVSSRKAGCRLSVGVLTGGMNRQGLESAGAHHVLDSAAQILEILDRLAGA